jgi:DNA helicase-2/ATP-dependent DNA helicase PcrA
MSLATPRELARLLGGSAPTGQQAAVIAAPVEPLLVVAGAGSGKTETMAARVLWLVANEHVRPDQVLGLTFTRRAAGALATRIAERLSRLERSIGPDDRLAGQPSVTTYHAYAARVVREHGVRAGYEPVTRLLTEAARWQLADAVVRGYDGDMSFVTSSPSTVTDAVLQLADDLAEHLCDPVELSAWTGRLFALVQSTTGKMPARVRDLLSRQRARLQLLPLVRAYLERKRSLEAMDFGDQLARGAELAAGHPEVGALERDRYRVVMLDEYQDTSHAQVILLKNLFGGGHPVVAVGDPCQSIYGWRGASSGTLERFPDDFPPARVLSLTTSWRNRPEILDVANALSRPLREFGHRVAELAPADVVAQSISGTTVRCALLETYAAEASWLADQILLAWRARAGVAEDTPASEIPPESCPSTAVLVRTRAQIPVIEEALRERGLPVDVVGLGGLIDAPEVRDVVSTLHVLADPGAGAALLRLLTGPRWRIGPRDLVALYRRARDLVAQRRLTASSPEDSAPVLPEYFDEAALIEALDDLGEAERYSPPGYQRFSQLAAELRQLRSRLDQPLADLVGDIERTSGLDVEVAARDGSGLARGHLDAFGLVAAEFAATAPAPTISGFLAYLTAAENVERGLTPGEVEVVAGAVQILTAHSAKGLEWDLVAVAGLTTEVFPTRSNSGDHWLRGLGVLPFDLRGDAAFLPAFEVREGAEASAVVLAIESFEAAWREHALREERRLAYVAVTRARRLLLASGYWWANGAKRKRGPSPFLSEIRQRCLAGAGEADVWTPDPGREAENPTTAELPKTSWPGDPLGSRRAAMARAAAMVRSAPAGGPDWRADPLVDDWTAATLRLLTEHSSRVPQRGELVEVPLPAQLAVSQLVRLKQDPATFASSLRRPLPARPEPISRRGTAFHRWLEGRFAADRLFDLDDLPGAADEDVAPDEDLERLKLCFLSSEWSRRTPVDVEVPFSTVVAGIVLRGRIDAVFAWTPGDGSDGGGDGPGGDGGQGYEVVDWKTGGLPSGPAAGAAAVQLAVYRLAWAALANVPVGRVRAAFHYVRPGMTIRPADLLSESRLTELIMSLPVAGDGDVLDG